MSLEQLIVLVALAVALLVRAAREASQRQAATPTQQLPPEPAPVRRVAARRAAPTPRASDPASARYAAPGHTPRGSTERPERTEALAPGVHVAPRPTPLFRILPGDVSALRRAVVLSTVLGPPRASKPAGLDAR